MKTTCRCGIRGRPGLDFHRHKVLKPFRCQPITVAGWTRTRSRDHSAQSRRSTTQKTRSSGRSQGRFALRRYTASCCCRNAAFSTIRVALGITTARGRVKRTDTRVCIGVGLYHAETAVSVERCGFSRTTRAAPRWSASWRPRHTNNLAACHRYRATCLRRKCLRSLPRKPAFGGRRRLPSGVRRKGTIVASQPELISIAKQSTSCC